MSGTWFKDPGRVAADSMADVSAAGQVEAAYRRIDEAEPAIKAFVALRRDAALAEAEALDRSGVAERAALPLFGLPVAIKDVIDVAGLPTRAGSATRAAAPPANSDALTVARLRAAGAVVVGKAHTTEYAYFEGPPPTRNPHDLTRTPGGSSAGSAAAVAAGMVRLALGTQTAGSVSRPAAYCGIGAFKPSTLAMPSHGMVPFSANFDTIGLFGFRYADAARGFRAIAPDFLRGFDRDLEAPTIRSAVVIDDPVLERAVPAVRHALSAAIEAMRRSGLDIRRLRSPVSFTDLIDRHKAIIEYDLARAHPTLSSTPDLISAGIAAALRRGADVTDTQWRTLLRRVAEARRTFWSAIGTDEAVLLPATPDVAPIGMATGDPSFIVPLTALGGPIASIPFGAGEAGMPLGIMLSARPGSDWDFSQATERIAEDLRAG